MVKIKMGIPNIVSNTLIIAKTENTIVKPTKAAVIVLTAFWVASLSPLAVM
jgi:hypothetical protein